MKIRGHKYLIVILLTLAGVLEIKSLHLNKVEAKDTSVIHSHSSDESRFSISKEIPDTKFELAQCEIVEGSVDSDKKFDSDGGFVIPSSLLSTTYTFLIDSKLSLKKFYRFYPLLDSLYIICCVYRL